MNGDGGRGREGDYMYLPQQCQHQNDQEGGKEIICTYHNSVNTRMTPALIRWAAMRAILMFD